jgi:secreted trypsin-like serine protease
MLCAKSEGVSAAPGDSGTWILGRSLFCSMIRCRLTSSTLEQNEISGGPLVIVQNLGESLQVGVVSWGLKGKFFTFTVIVFV